MNRIARDLAAVAGALAAMLVVHLVPISTSTELDRRLLSALHAPAFAVLALLVRTVLAGHLGAARPRSAGPRLPPLALDAAAFAAAAVAGVLFELAQIAGPRSAELFDLAADMSGAAGGLMLRAAWRAPRENRRALSGAIARVALAGAGAGLLAVPALPAAVRAAQMKTRDRALPMLGAFEEPWELGFWRARRGELAIVPPLPGWTGASGRGVACVRHWTRTWPGLTIPEPPPDWSGYDRLVVEAFNLAGKPVTLHVRIDDAPDGLGYFDRYNDAFELPVGPSRIVIDLGDVRAAPRTRDLDLTHVTQLALFLERPQEPLTLCFDRIRLERADQDSPDASASSAFPSSRKILQSSMPFAPSAR